MKLFFTPNLLFLKGFIYISVNNVKTVFTVKAVVGDKIDVDGNHPLAGETLHFSVEITGIREAAQDELNQCSDPSCC